jgi:hypothetical protein
LIIIIALLQLTEAFRTVADNNRTIAGPRRPPMPGIHADPARNDEHIRPGGAG